MDGRSVSWFEGVDTSRIVSAVVGPAAFLLIWQLAPPYAGLGVMVWLAVYWAMGVCPVLWTAAIPLIGFSLIGVNVWTILTSYVHPALILIVGPTLAIVAAVNSGLIERLAMFFIRKLGTNVRTHVMFWLVFATVLSDFSADVVCSLALIPIAIKILARAGFEDVKSIASSKSAMLVIIAVATGSGLGGILTPMAGGQAAITWVGLNKVLGGEVTAWSYTLRFLIPTTCSLAIVAAVFYFLPLSEKVFNFTRASEPRAGRDFKDDSVPPWSRREIVSAFLLALAVCLPYVRPWLPLTLPWIYGILMLVTMLIYVPKEGMLLPVSALKQFPLNAISVWPIAMSVSVLIGVAGTGAALQGVMSSILGGESLWSVGLWVLSCISLAQVASDTGTAGMLIPILADALPKMGINPVPWILMTGFSVDFSFMVPTATGTIGVLYALGGRSHWRLPLYGFACAFFCGLFSWAFWAMVIVNKWSFWYTLDVVK